MWLRWKPLYNWLLCGKRANTLALAANVVIHSNHLMEQLLASFTNTLSEEGQKQLEDVWCNGVTAPDQNDHFQGWLLRLKQQVLSPFPELLKSGWHWTVLLGTISIKCVLKLWTKEKFRLGRIHPGENILESRERKIQLEACYTSHRWRKHCWSALVCSTRDNCSECVHIYFKPCGFR